MSLLSLAQRGDRPALLRAAQAELAAGRPLSSVTHPKSGDSALHVAARAGRPEVLGALLGLGLGVEVRNLEGKTALHEAAQAGQEGAVTVLLGAGAEVNAIKRADWTPLMLACTKVENTAVAALLLEAGASPELRNKDGWTAWHLAVRTGDTALLSLLLARAPCCWATASTNLRSPLHTAALKGDTVTLDFLLSPPCNYDLEAADSCGNTALLEAGRGGHREAMVRLDREGADRGARDSMGRGVVKVAVQAGSVQCVQLCRDWGLLEGEQLSQEGQNLLHTAAREGQTEMLRLLLSWQVPGLDLDHRDRHGRTPLWLAVSGQHLSSLLLLLQAGAEAGLRDSSGLGLEQLAREEGVREAVTAALHHTGL